MLDSAWFLEFDQPAVFYRAALINVAPTPKDAVVVDIRVIIVLALLRSAHSICVLVGQYGESNEWTTVANVTGYAVVHFDLTQVGQSPQIALKQQFTQTGWRFCNCRALCACCGLVLCSTSGSVRAG